MSNDPLFVDADGADNIPGNADDDFHLQSSAGSWHGGAWTADPSDSPSIDAGDPATSVGDEPAPNGGRINMGAYAGTDQASKTAVSSRILTILSPNGGEVWSGTRTIRWSASGGAWQAGDTMKLEYSADGGTSWQEIAGASSLAYNSAVFSWDTASATPNAGVNFRIRATCNQTSDSDISDYNFYLHNASIYYYVNDNSQSGDEYCSAVGNDANDGLSPSTPKASIQAIFNAYDLEGGDVILVDAGSYVLTATLTLVAADGGDSANPVRIIGTTHQSGTILNRNSASYDAISCSAQYVSVENLQVTGGKYGIYFTSGGNSTAINCRMYKNIVGIYLHLSDNVLISNCLIDNNSLYGISFNYSDNAKVYSNTVCKNATSQINFEYSTDGGALRNNIMWADSAGKYCIKYSGTGSSLGSSDFNAFYLTSGALIGSGASQASLADWQAATGFDANSMSNDPLFVDADGADNIPGNADDDFHLQSSAGSWHGGTWTVDTSDSLCIDAGDPDLLLGDEPEPNGGRLNLGVYGGTVQASKTPDAQILTLLSPNGGNSYKGTIQILWNADTLTWPVNDTVSIFYSSDNGANWHTIAGATNIMGSLETYAWDLFGLLPGNQYKVKIVHDQNLSEQDESDSTFTVIPCFFFVNDNSLLDDEYSTVTGNDLNDGKTPETPKASIQSVINAYDLEAGDIIYVDSGTYLLSADITTTVADSGSIASPVIIRGVKGKTIVDRNNTATGWTFPHLAAYIAIENLTLVNARGAISISTGSRVRDCKFSGNALYAIFTSELAKNFEITGNLIEHAGTDAAILLEANLANAPHLPCLVANNTIIANKGIRIEAESGPVIRNNIISSQGSGGYCFNTYLFYGHSSDYNDLYATEGAYIVRKASGYATDGEDCPILAEWLSLSGQDFHSRSQDPLFADPANHEFHLKSTEGRWDPALNGGIGGWVTDTVLSPCIDAGNPSDEIGDELAPNGGRINIGAYGGTTEASKSPSSGRWLIFESAGESVVLHAFEPLRWSACGSNWQGDETVRLDYSADSGATWNPINGADSLQFNAGIFWLDTRSFPSGEHYMFRVSSNSGTPVSAVSEMEYKIYQIFKLEYFSGTNGTIAGATPQFIVYGDSGTPITATPNTGYHFVAWSDGPTANPRTEANVTADIGATANLALNEVLITTSSTTLYVNEGAVNTFSIRLSAQPLLSTTVSVSVVSGDSDITVLSGSSLTFTTSNWATYQTVTLSASEDADIAAGTTTVCCSSAGLADKNVFAFETDNDTTLYVNNNGYGTTSPSGATIVTKGFATQIIATPNTGYYFVNWTVIGGSATFGNANLSNTTATILSTATIRANFAINTYTLTYNAPNGSISGTNPQAVNHGGNGTQVTALANPGFRFISWSDGLLTASRTDSNITAPLAVTAIFAEKPAWDFNGDGKSDVICESPLETGFIYFMNGHLVALSSEVYKKTDTDWKIAKIADFNGDGKADILWEHQTSGQILLYIMNGSVICSVKTLYAGLSGGIGWRVKDLADFNGDGKADILWEHNYGYGYIALMDGNIVAGGGAVYARSPNTRIEKIADFSGDGKADILWELEDGTGYVFVMNGSSVASEAAIYSRSPQWQIVEYADFNGDAKTDILWEHSDGTGYVYLMNGATISSHGYAYKKSDIGWTVKKIGDFNGDGKDDLLWEHSAGIGCVYLMNGLVIADYHNIYSLKDINPATRWDIVKILDFNGDGKSDMLWESTATKKTLVYLMDGLAISSSGTVYSNGTGWNLLK